MALVSEPGSRVAYHPVTSWSILERAILERTGKDLRELARDRVLGPGAEAAVLQPNVDAPAEGSDGAASDSTEAAESPSESPVDREPTAKQEAETTA